MKGKKSVGLALSGGGARGFCHLGIIKALEELNISLDRVVDHLSKKGIHIEEKQNLVLFRYNKKAPFIEGLSSFSERRV